MSRMVVVLLEAETAYPSRVSGFIHRTVFGGDHGSHLFSFLCLMGTVEAIFLVFCVWWGPWKPSF
jgi:hypothetical protein